MAAASAEQLKMLVRSQLMSESTITDVVGGSIYGAHLQDPDARTVPYPMVVLDFRAGFANTSSYQSVNMYLWAYSRENSGEALRLYDLCQAALQQQVLRKTGISVAGYVVEEVRPYEGWNDNVRAYFARGQFTVRAAARS